MFFARVVFGLVAGLAGLSAAAGDALKPNVVLIFTDDQGYGDLGVYGAVGFETPHIDQMAAEGVRFTDFYVSSPACTPSRASLLTGSYPTRIGLPDVLSHRNDIGLNPDEWSLAKLLRDEGYATACFGKWHLGYQEAFLPLQHGFDEFYGIPYSNDMWPKHPTNKSFPDLPLIEGNEIVEYNPDQTQFTKNFTQRAVDFIERHQDAPFFVYLPHPMPHVPLFASAAFAGSTEQGAYGDVIAELDWSVGQILQTLREKGLDKNTLVIYTSDNGPWLNYGNHAGSAGPFREGKGTTFEGGVRVPFVAWWPGTIRANRVNGEVAATIDLLPTLAYLAGAEMPRDRIIDGHNIWPLLQGVDHAVSPHDAYFLHNGDELQAVRVGKWKLHREHHYRTIPEPGMDGLPGPQEHALLPVSLFDLASDPGETTNLAKQRPAMVARLLGLMDAFEAECKANAREPGKVSP